MNRMEIFKFKLENTTIIIQNMYEIIWKLNVYNMSTCSCCFSVNTILLTKCISKVPKKTFKLMFTLIV